MTADPGCLFCKIVAGEVEADVVHSSEHCLAFRDLEPQAPVHLLVIPRRHEPDVGSLVRAAPAEAAALLAAARAAAESEGVADNFRLVANTGRDAHQSVFHAHLHVLAGRSFDWPPG
ncbi:MAG: HIT domain-containing protein [Nocardioidaceae bacterium]